MCRKKLTEPKKKNVLKKKNRCLVNNTVEVLVEAALAVLVLALVVLDPLADRAGKVLAGLGLVEDAREEGDGDVMRAGLVLPVGEELAKEVDRFLVVHFPVHIELPHFWW